jgi:hypothetical protein
MRHSAPFWRRGLPKPQYDIALLRPAHLPKKQRFETKSDVRKESSRSELLLNDHSPAVSLRECRARDYTCDKPSCPVCARRFRRWWIGELIRISASTDLNILIATLLLASVPRDHLSDLEPKAHIHKLRKRLERSGLADVVAIGGLEVVYKARTRSWVLHVHLMLLGADPAALETFEDTFADSKLSCPTKVQPLIEPPEQLSYLLKFHTYHRPSEQCGPMKPRAKPLNRREHLALAQWMHQREFTDFMFLFNARRYGARIRPR